VREMYLYFRFCKGMDATQAYGASHIPSLLQQWGVDPNWSQEPATFPREWIEMIRKQAIEWEVRL